MIPGALKTHRSSAINLVSMAPPRPYVALSSALRRQANQSGWTTWDALVQRCISLTARVVALETIIATITKMPVLYAKVSTNYTEIF